MLTLRVTPREGDPYEVETNLFTIVAWERRFKRPASDLGSQMAVEWLVYMAWEASKQSSVPVPPVFDDFVKRLVSVEVVDKDTDPTDPVPTDEL